MKTRKILWILLPVLAAAIGAAWFWMSHLYTDGSFYPKNARMLDLRGEPVTAEQHDAIQAALPECEILWDIPFQGKTYPMDTEELQIETLTQEDIQTLHRFGKLKTVDANACRDYAALAALRETFPELTVYCTVQLNGKTYDQSTKSLLLTGLTEEELTALTCLPELEKVVAGGRDTARYERLQEYCREMGIAFYVKIGSEELDMDTKELTLANATAEQLDLLRLLPKLEAVHLQEPEAPAEAVIRLSEELTQTRVTWEKTLLGMTFPGDAEVIDLSDVLSRGPDDADRGGKTAWEYGAERFILGDREEFTTAIKTSQYHPLPDRIEETEQILAEAEAAMPYFPNAKQLVLCGARMKNLAMGEFREAHREDFKLVWTVQCGAVAVRTDTTFFMPTKYQVYYFFDTDAYNLRYCEDIECIDLGHMLVYDLDFVRYMPKLKYLVITLSGVTNIEPLSTCKNLVFLEMDWTEVKDYSPLLECTALEDLNIGETFGDMEPIYKMTWLKNLWLVGCGKDVYYKAQQTLPDTVNIAYAYKNPDDGWRMLPNYFKMRDALLMFYMP